MISRHPGGIIRRRYLEPLKLTMTDLAEAMGVSLSSVSRVVNEKAELTSEMALRLSHVIGGTPEMWMGLQTAYSLEKAKSQFTTEGLKRLNPAIAQEAAA
ncbi:HigA family addiction module antitoxin [Pseudomonas aeruginosa]|nr:HigA family addiction module antitoxin [Pseudomonas aeruginosa]MCS8513327.1 HigA family addiction module antitoxin [Pseudomonas aeruginosa]MCS8543829.1 HigA family addiction module antitoxin [Pseudomonas aeruginosa]MCT0604159.1 HigA family addiction module antitoxin [Pseudomonas aeruginosa]